MYNAARSQPKRKSWLAWEETTAVRKANPAPGPPANTAIFPERWNEKKRRRRRIGMVAPREKHYTARVVERKDLSEDLWLVRVDPGGPFSFKAGQYATLGVDHADKLIERAYSIVSSPYEEGTLEFFIELVPQGKLTPHLYKLQKGDTLLCRKIAKGRF